MILRSDGLASLVAATMLLTAAASPTGPACDAQRTPQLAGVQCESCHGRGKDHVGRPWPGRPGA